MNKTTKWFSDRWLVFIALAVVTPLGFACKGYFGHVPVWFNHYGGGVLYEVFFCLLAFLFWYNRRYITPIAIWVLAITCSLEFLQLWHPDFLNAARATLPGKMLLGTTFVWWDLPHYVIGCGLGWLIMNSIYKRKPKRSPAQI
ncbi:MAG TPA: DUF2809 domain-containing protein [Phycisphaerales bacterium]|nr:DUF2809 domain-containing protein [Phycisphaerales bacterium]